MIVARPTTLEGRVKSLRPDVQFEKLKGCDKVFKEKRSGIDSGRPALKQCLEFLRDGDTLLVTKIDRLARSTSDLYRIVSELAEKGVSFRVLDDPSIDSTSRTGKLVMDSLSLPSLRTTFVANGKWTGLPRQRIEA